MSGSQVDKCVDCRGVMFAIYLNIGFVDCLEHLFGFLELAIQFEEHRLIVDNAAVGWVVFWKVLLDVFLVVV